MNDGQKVLLPGVGLDDNSMKVHIEEDWNYRYYKRMLLERLLPLRTAPW